MKLKGHRGGMLDTNFSRFVEIADGLYIKCHIFDLVSNGQSGRCFDKVDESW